MASANAAASAPVESTSSTSTIATQASEAEWYSSAFVRQGLMQPRCSAFSSGACRESAFSCSAPAVSVKSDEYFAQILGESAHICLPMRSILAARCQGKMGMGVKRRYEGMLEKDPRTLRLAC